MNVFKMRGAVAVVGAFVLAAVASGAITSELQGTAGTDNQPELFDLLTQNASSYEPYENLEAMVRDTDVVVRGSIVSIVPGRQIGSTIRNHGDNVETVVARIRVDDTVRGATTERSGELLQLELFPGSGIVGIEELRSAKGGDDLIFFLKDEANEEGPAVADVGPTAGKPIYHVATPLGLFDEAGDDLTTPLDHHPYEPFRRSVTATSLDQLADDVRSIS